MKKEERGGVAVRIEGEVSRLGYIVLTEKTCEPSDRSIGKGVPYQQLSAGIAFEFSQYPNDAERCSTQINNEIVRGTNLTGEPGHVSDDLDHASCKSIDRKWQMFRPA